MKPWWQVDSQAATAQCSTDPERGLTLSEAARRLTADGPNELVEGGTRSPWAIVWKQVTVTMVVLLIVSAAVSAAVAAADTWSPTGPMSIDRRGHGATRLADGRVLVSGGFSNISRFLATAEIYDPAQSTWSLTGSMSTDRNGHTRHAAARRAGAR